MGYFFFFLANSSILKVGSLPVKVLRLLVSPMSIVLCRATNISRLFALDFESKLIYDLSSKEYSNKASCNKLVQRNKIVQLGAICTTASWYIHRLLKSDSNECTTTKKQVSVHLVASHLLLNSDSYSCLLQSIYVYDNISLGTTSCRN